jgi:hypothetical protein
LTPGLIGGSFNQTRPYADRVIHAGHAVDAIERREDAFGARARSAPRCGFSSVIQPVSTLVR